MRISTVPPDMPRVTVYVPDDLKARMDEADDLNWSSLAQGAFAEALVRRELRRKPNDMTNVIERLRASKARFEENETAAGKNAGARWARHSAEYEDLMRVNAAAQRDAQISLAELEALLDPDRDRDRGDWRDFWSEFYGEGSPGDAFAEGFVEGAIEVFDEISDQL